MLCNCHADNGTTTTTTAAHIAHTTYSLKSNYFIGKFLMNALCIRTYSKVRGEKIINQPVYHTSNTCKFPYEKMDKNQLNELIIICKARFCSFTLFHLSLTLTRSLSLCI